MLLWHRLTAEAVIWPLAWECPYAVRLALKRKQKKTNNKKQSLLTNSTHMLGKLILLASIYDSKTFSVIKRNYDILHRVIKVHVKK